ncbi:MAG: hypothetical protein DRJ51_00245 [Thermoprotei archaeon]|nr:MAG: hypothetical protein DRJ51_00245 [Thermoprotei archaeon]RLE82946.1 MAG: hypothetical protein DRJ36_00130 [Thermoprotei archaeon]RLF03077.1 MAG: hypothetical protein DRJ59_01800 [Thermoprotei archaeon]
MQENSRGKELTIFINQIRDLDLFLQKFYETLREKRSQLISTAYSLAEGLRRDIQSVVEDLLAKEERRVKANIEKYRREMEETILKESERLKKLAEKKREEAIEHVTKCILPSI